MAEWLLLLLLVPAIVVPVVLLVGFAGCNQVFGIQSTTVAPFPPILVSAEGTSGSIIHLTWTWTGDPQTLKTFHFVRTNPDGTETPFDANPSTSPFATDDMSLQPATTYGYRVQAVLNDGSSTDFSPAPPAPPLPATTLPFTNTFHQTLTGPGTDNGIDWQGLTLVQRIDPGRLSTSGTQQVILTLVAGSDVSAAIDRIYISRPDPTAAMTDPLTYQPDAADLKPVATSPFPVPPSGHDADHPVVLTLSPANYALDHTKALLIAVDFTAPPGATESWIRFANVNPGEGTAYYIQGAEASNMTRSANYNRIDNRIYFIANIDVK
jgi:hypothetical protein